MAAVITRSETDPQPPLRFIETWRLYRFVAGKQLLPG
jgi:hypothetical protein